MNETSEMDWGANEQTVAPRDGFRMPEGLKKGKPGRLYIISFVVPRKDGSSFRVYKPGITSQEKVVYTKGLQGRYRQKDKVEVVFEREFSDIFDAWIIEQKLLALMPDLPWKRRGDNSPVLAIYAEENRELRRMRIEKESRGFWLRLLSVILKDTTEEKKLALRNLTEKRVEEYRNSLNEFDAESFYVKDWWKTLGPTEWRSWPYSEDSLIKAVEDVIKFSAE